MRLHHDSPLPACSTATPLVSPSGHRPAAETIRAGDLEIDSSWTRAAGANANGAGFLRITNRGSVPDRLVAAATDAARVVELHTHIREGEVMRMRPCPTSPSRPARRWCCSPAGCM